MFQTTLNAPIYKTNSQIFPGPVAPKAPNCHPFQPTPMRLWELGPPNFIHLPPPLHYHEEIPSFLFS